MAAEITGLELARRFYTSAVRPLLAQYYPGLPHTAGLIGSGSEILGFDDGMSRDHHWGPRVMLFLGEEDLQKDGEAIRQMLANTLAYEFEGYPTNFSEPDAADHGTQHLSRVTQGPVRHRVELMTIRSFFKDYINLDIEHPVEALDWLTISQQHLLTITQGALFHDDLGLQQQRDRFSYYPQDVWVYLMAAGWARIGQEEHLMGRAGLVNDEVGSALIGARLVRDVITLCFLMEKRYAPYPKWFGTAFKNLSCGPGLWPVLQSALGAATWQAREKPLVQAYEKLACMHNALGLTAALPEKSTLFFGRPFKVMALQGFSDALVREIKDPQVREIASRTMIGSIDLFSDNTDLLENVSLRPALKALFR